MKKYIALILTCVIVTINAGCTVFMPPTLFNDEDENEYSETGEDVLSTGVYTENDGSFEIVYGSEAHREYWNAVLNAPGQPFNHPTYQGQCTGFAWFRFYQVYGFDSGARGNGDQNASEIVNAHSDDFELSSSPKAGSVFSWRDRNGSPHVGFVERVDGNNLWISDGNYGRGEYVYNANGGRWKRNGGFRINQKVTKSYMNQNPYLAYAVPKKPIREIAQSH